MRTQLSVSAASTEGNEAYANFTSPLPFKHADPDNHQHKQPPTHLSAHILCCALWQNRWLHMGTFLLAVVTTVNQAVLSRFSFLLPVRPSELCCWCRTAAAKPDMDTSVKQHRWGGWSSSLKVGVSVFSSLGSVFFQISVSLQSLFMRLLWAGGAIKSQLVKTPHFHHFSQ